MGFQTRPLRSVARDQQYDRRVSIDGCNRIDHHLQRLFGSENGDRTDHSRTVGTLPSRKRVPTGTGKTPTVDPIGDVLHPGSR